MTISGVTQILALFGNPVTHSLSPQLHEGWLDHHAIDAAYVALSLALEGPDQTLRALSRVGFLGANITVPFKEAAAQAADRRSADVDALGAANVLHWTATGVAAHNTDAEGFTRALDEALPTWRREAHEVLVIGAGGAARAIAYGLAQAGVGKLTIANRTVSRAVEVVRAISPVAGLTDICEWPDLASGFARADLIVNATSRGMYDHSALSVPWPIDSTRADAIVCDAVYAPLETDLLKAARARGLRTVDGLGMLIHQGALAFEIWFGIRPDTAKARERLLAILAARG